MSVQTEQDHAVAPSSEVGVFDVTAVGLAGVVRDDGGGYGVERDVAEEVEVTGFDLGVESRRFPGDEDGDMKEEAAVCCFD